MKFSKDSKTPDSIPQAGINRAVRLMETGRLYRYNFDRQFINQESKPTFLKDELASEVAQLEAEFGQYTGHQYVVAVNSCGSALFLSLKAAGLQPGEKVLTTAFTFTAVPSSIVHAGGVPVYVECTHQYITDTNDLQRKIEQHPDVKYFILSHMRGHISDLDAIKSICDQAGIYLIEDCAHSLGSTWFNRHKNKKQLVGHHGNIACFSSQSYKLLNSGEGGFFATNDEQVAAYCILAAGSYEELYKKHLARPFNDDLFEQLKPHVPNFSMRMNNLTAAVLRPQIPVLPEKIDQYNQRYNQLVNILSAAENIYIPSTLDPVSRVGDSVQFNLLNLTLEQIDQFVEQTKQRGVKIQVFGRFSNARYFKNWKYSFDDVPDLKQTDKVISCACDLRISLSFNSEDINLIGYIIKDVLYQVVSAGNRVDYKKGLTDYFGDVKEVQTWYDAWVSDYDEEHLRNGWKVFLNYIAYNLTLQLNDDSKILDVGCGTGLLGKELKSYGFNQLYGLDISKKSLKTAGELEIYQDLYQGELGSPLKLESNSFDLLVSSGVFTRNQVPLNAFEELIRVLKPGGLFVVAFRVEDNDFYYKEAKEYCEKNIWREVSKTRLSILQSCNHDLVTFQKL
jgi:dTDP-4-amino-4,6-dideoxygalactose transaminase/ubiquinone/menaquinone biosynthesis C-methylase UbiE